MKIDVIFCPVTVDELYFTNRTTVVIDVLRASSVITTALQNGAKEIIPVANVEFAVKLSGGMFGGQTLLGGERNTKKIEGFALGNSPLEYTHEIVGGKSIVLYTTNGTKAIAKAKFSENLFICSFLNLSALTKHLVELKKDFVIICSGRANHFSLEDTICAGKLISEISETIVDNELSDSAKASLILCQSFSGDILEMFKNSEHGKILMNNGFEEDLIFCSRVNSTDALPILSGNAIKLFNK